MHHHRERLGAMMPLVAYVFLYTLAVTAYQIGIVIGMVTHRSLFLPNVAFRR